MFLVAHTGFGPVISSLRGKCPKPLDEWAKRRAIAIISVALVICKTKKAVRERQKVFLHQRNGGRY